MKLIKSLATTLLALFMLASCAEKEVYLFSGHREPALDGLHFLYSFFLWSFDYRHLNIDWYNYICCCWC